MPVMMRPGRRQGQQQTVVNHTVGCGGMCQRRSPLQDSLDWDVALGTLLGTYNHECKTRPVHLIATASMQIYVERRPVRRCAGGDKWRNSGGKRGGTDHWVNEQLGLRKRYGRVVRMGGRPPLKFMRFALLHRQDHGAEVTEDRNAALYTVEGTVDELESTVEQLQRSLSSATTSRGSLPSTDLANLQFAPNAMGGCNHVTRGKVVAMGGWDKANGTQGVTMGGSNQAAGLGAFAMGLGYQAIGPMAFAIGMENQATTYHSSEAVATSGETYAKKFNIMATKAHATNGTEQLRAVLQLPVHNFSPSDDDCVSHSTEGKGNVSHQLQSISTVAAIQEQHRMIGQLQHMVQEQGRIISTLIK